jgi:hypothetical protein
MKSLERFWKAFISAEKGGGKGLRGQGEYASFYWLSFIIQIFVYQRLLRDFQRSE